ncbi:hypothetical protein TOPH_05967 [Tolypocladium ophioglossoides CBS 100239]|uniref:TauD/TfdA-like domain-containing protein n=1 Tax=Tolypocladium ophioglossoides (strain CBS 100239) TaxID=1163406 RepID=A0A0L0N680_TOLOC|nr:hypothetical protein TOPH_05967 [Tolypocladium ophioglossoides CBS 100239]
MPHSNPQEGAHGDLVVDMVRDGAVSEIPGILTGPLVWSGADFKDQDSYTLRLSSHDIKEIEAALETFKSLGLDGDQVSQPNFPLPNLASRLSKVAETLHEGRGFVVISGLDASRYSVEDSVLLYLGLAEYVADKRGQQDKRGNVLSHITNSKLWDVPVEQRHAIHSNKALPFHNDMGCDLLALQVRRSAHSGGSTYLSSVWAVFNTLVREEPEVARSLLTPDWPVQISGRTSRHYLAPAFAIHERRLMASLDPNRFGRHPASTDADIPALNAAQTHALERVSAVARKTELELRLETGDLVFFNNWAVLHRRDAYEDGKSSSRHLVRLWLRNTRLGWPVPPQMLPPWQAAYGETSKTKTRIYSLYPMATYAIPKYSAGSAAFLIEDSDE